MINMVVDLDYQDGIQTTQESTLRHVCKSTSREFWLKEDELPCVWEHHSISRSLQDCFILEEWTGGLTVKNACCSCRRAEFSSHTMQLTIACVFHSRGSDAILGLCGICTHVHIPPHRHSYVCIMYVHMYVHIYTHTHIYSKIYIFHPKTIQVYLFSE